MEITQTLQNLGLSEKEAKIYIALLAMPSATAYLISLRSGLKKPTVYVILENLVQKGFVLKMPQSKKTLYFAKSPQECIGIFEERLNEAKDILPKLIAMQKKSNEKVSVSYFEGLEEVKELYKDTLKYPEREFVAFGSEDIFNLVGNRWMDGFIEERVKKKISVRAIMPQTNFIKENLFEKDPKQMRTVKMVDRNEFPLSIEIDVYGNSKTSLFSGKEALAVLIESTEVHNTMKSIFELLWKKLP